MHALFGASAALLTLAGLQVTALAVASSVLTGLMVPEMSSEPSPSLIGAQASMKVPSVNAALPLGQPLSVPDTQRKFGVKITYPAVPFWICWVETDEMLLLIDSVKSTEGSDVLTKAKRSEMVPSSSPEMFTKRFTVTKPPTETSQGVLPLQTTPVLIMNGEGPGRVYACLCVLKFEQVARLKIESEASAMMGISKQVLSNENGSIMLSVLGLEM